MNIMSSREKKPAYCRSGRELADSILKRLLQDEQSLKTELNQTHTNDQKDPGLLTGVLNF
jgi:hypothetical protein